MYSSEYFEGGDVRCGHTSDYCDQEAEDQIVNKRFLQEIIARKAGGSFLEVGCAGGAFLHAVRETGYSVKGVELSAEASKLAVERYGLSVFTGSLEEARFAGGEFDVVYMGDVIEHLPDPLRTIQEIHRIMKTGGLLALELPSQTNTLFSRAGFFLYGMLRKSVTVSLPPYHLFEYRPRSLKFLLASCGFERTEIHQGIFRPRDIHLRGPAMQRWGKKILQYPNWLVTRTCGEFGDRITAFAVKSGVLPGERLAP